MHFLAVGFAFVLFTAGLQCAAADRHVVLITIDGFPAEMLADPKTPIPHIRELAAAGVVAEAMRVSTPAVTWPNHTTLVTGVHPEKHAVLYNGVLTRKSPDEPVAVDPKKTRAELVAAPTVYDLLHRQGLTTAAINWPATREASTLQDDFPDVPDSLQYTTPRLLQELVAGKVLPSTKEADFRAMTGPARDEVWTRAVEQVVSARRPNLLLFHLLNTDGIHHRYGPQSPASHTALALADNYVGRVLDALDRAGIRTNTTIFITSDHGFANVTNVLFPNALFREAGLIEVNASNKVVKARAQVISEGGLGMIYLNNPATREADRDRVIQLLQGKPGVVEVLQPSQFSAYGLPQPASTNGMADLVLVAAEGFGVSASATADSFVGKVGLADNLGYHGYVGKNPRMNAAFVVAGKGIKKGAKIKMIENISVAPTIAHLLGCKLETADGPILREILE